MKNIIYKSFDIDTYINNFIINFNYILKDLEKISYSYTL
jgi:hypothetical protein